MPKWLPRLNTNLKIFSISNETKLEQIATSLSNYNVTLLMVSNQELYIYLCWIVYHFNWNSRQINIIPIFPLSILEWVWRIYAKNKERFYFSVTERILQKLLLIVAEIITETEHKVDDTVQRIKPAPKRTSKASFLTRNN